MAEEKALVFHIIIIGCFSGEKYQEFLWVKLLERLFAMRGVSRVIRSKPWA